MKHYWNIEGVVRFPCQHSRSPAGELMLDVTMPKWGIKVIYNSHQCNTIIKITSFPAFS